MLLIGENVTTPAATMRAGYPYVGIDAPKYCLHTLRSSVQLLNMLLLAATTGAAVAPWDGGVTAWRDIGGLEPLVQTLPTMNLLATHGHLRLPRQAIAQRTLKHICVAVLYHQLSHANPWRNWYPRCMIHEGLSWRDGKSLLGLLCKRRRPDWLQLRLPGRSHRLPLLRRDVRLRLLLQVRGHAGQLLVLVMHNRPGIQGCLGSWRRLHLFRSFAAGPKQRLLRQRVRRRPLAAEYGAPQGHAALLKCGER
mmetsp:Transcript_126216/g.232435  ORF Transcript_126216/g.232435 Transcript_126216/m.232435 type:complete len:251 (+) Transcript_126216:195-947(+)